MIETDLAVTADDPAFDEAAFTDLVEQACAYLDSRGAAYETIRIESVRAQ